MPHASLCQSLSQTCYPILSITVIWSQGASRLLPLKRGTLPLPPALCERSVIQVYRLTRLPLRWHGRTNASVAFVGGFSRCIQTSFALVLPNYERRTMSKPSENVGCCEDAVVKKNRRKREEPKINLRFSGKKMECGTFVKSTNIPQLQVLSKQVYLLLIKCVTTSREICISP